MAEIHRHQRMVNDVDLPLKIMITLVGLRFRRMEGTEKKIKYGPQLTEYAYYIRHHQRYC